MSFHQAITARHTTMRLTIDALVGVVAFHRASAWSDEGHMLVAAVASAQLPIDTVHTLNNALQGWLEFSNFSDIVGGAVWMDHAKCEQGVMNARCNGLRTSVALKLFDSMHYEVHAYNPSNITLPKQPWRSASTHALTAIESADESLRITTSSFTSNLMLRLGLHVIGDLHQPLHTSQLFSVAFPNGDAGGNGVKLVGQQFSNLHKFWDAAGGLFAGAWPIPSADLIATANSIVAEHHAESFVREGRLHGDWNNISKGFGMPLDTKIFFEGIVDDTQSLVPAVYAEYLAASESAPFAYSPSVDYVRAAKRNATAQIALGGYRLAQWLSSVVARAPTQLPRSTGIHMLFGDSSQEGSVGTQSLGHELSQFFFGAVLGAIAMLMVVLACAVLWRCQTQSQLISYDSALQEQTGTVERAHDGMGRIV
eukprot:TRINITY_DN10548_c0_g1_i1.p1 TRINITY_DN10548_c0_g1~~TRINITY_DN10548_c0_g1_i1.p1  ORF type:complete len:424 (-),score=38.05 TRINITY_DN10548_c0_g1_i1:157-1428(-)